MSKCYAVQIINGACPIIVEVGASYYQIEDGFVSFYADKCELIASFSCGVVDFVRLQSCEVDDE